MLPNAAQHQGAAIALERKPAADEDVPPALARVCPPSRGTAPLKSLRGRRVEVAGVDRFSLETREVDRIDALE